MKKPRSISDTERLEWLMAPRLYREGPWKCVDAHYYFVTQKRVTVGRGKTKRSAIDAAIRAGRSRGKR